MTLDDLLALAEKATPGPWETVEPYGVVAPTANIAGMWDGMQTGDSMRANRDYIAALSPERVKALVEVARAAGAFHKTFWNPWRSGRSQAMCSDAVTDAYGALRRALAKLDREMGG